MGNVNGHRTTATEIAGEQHEPAQALSVGSVYLPYDRHVTMASCDGLNMAEVTASDEEVAAQVAFFQARRASFWVQETDEPRPGITPPSRRDTVRWAKSKAMASALAAITALQDPGEPQLTKPGLSAAELQSKILAEGDFYSLKLSGRQMGSLLNHLCPLYEWSYADLLALGSEALREVTRYPNGRVLGRGKSLRYLGAVVAEQTGLTLPKHRATPVEQLRYYVDITKASPWLGLPHPHFARNENIGLTFGIRVRPCIQDFLTMPETRLDRESEIEEYDMCHTPFRGQREKRSGLEAFIKERLLEGVVKPFEAAKRARISTNLHDKTTCFVR